MDSSKKILVTGGSGYLGQELIGRLISMGYTNIVSVSRNEGAAVSLKERFPMVKIIIGDIADPWVVKKSMQGADEIFHLAALKHVGIAENDVKECVDSNIVGTMNIINESLITKPKVVVFVSSDKAAQPNGVYGCSKKIGERLVSEAERINPETKYRVVRYGNVWMSTFSIGPKWKPKMQKGEEIILTDPEASRFFWEVGEAVDLIFESIEKAVDSNPLVPHMKAVQMGTVLEACMEVWGKSPVKIIGLQPGENKVETTDGVIFSDQVEQFTKEEFKDKFLIDPKEKEYWQNLMDAIPKLKPKITCVIITREPELNPLVLERIDLDFFDEILVVTECPSVYHRYLAAEKAKNDIIYVQDDDCLVNYQVLFQKYNGQITNTMTLPFVEKYKDWGCTLVGWGTFFPRTMLSVFDRYIAKYGVDKHLLREADRIFTNLNQPWNTVIQPHEDLFQTTERMGYQPEHYKSMNEALGKCK